MDVTNFHNKIIEKTTVNMDYFDNEYGSNNTYDIYNAVITGQQKKTFRGYLDYNLQNVTVMSPNNVEECQFSKDVWKNNVYKTALLSILIILIAIATTVGNLLVMISFKIEPHLRTISNCFLLSLAVADIAIGIFSIPLYSMYILLDYHWPLGLFVCDTWLSLDYTMSNASVANLLLISFDRYFSVTRPLTYRAHRTPVKAGIMIALAWIISILLWTPWIMIWPRVVEEKRTNECYIAFMDNHSTGGIVLTVVTAIGAFFLPVFVMCILYFKIYRETEKRKKNFLGLQGVDHGSKKNSKRHLLAMCKSTHSNEKSKDTKFTHINNSTNLKSKNNNQNVMRKQTVFTNGPAQWNQCSHDGNSDQSQSIQQNKNQNAEDIKLHTISTSFVGSITYLVPSGNHSKPSHKNISFETQLSCQGNDKNAPKVQSKTNHKQLMTRKKRNGQEQKAAKTLSAILLAFIVTWTPYNIFVLIQTFSPCAIHPTFYAIGYWLCYLNSTINPLCYALCNELFRSSFIRILKCQWKKSRSSYVPQNINAIKPSTQ